MEQVAGEIRGPAPTGVQGDDRRMQPRYALVMKGLADHAKLVGAGSLEIIASNISETGILLHTDSSGMLAEHDILVLSFTPLHDGELIHVAVRVLWVRPGVSLQMGRTTFGCAWIDTPAERIARLLAPAREAATLRGIEEPY